MTEASSGGDWARTSKKDKAAIIAILISFAIVFAVLIAGIAIYIASSGSGSRPGQGSAESGFRNVIDGYNDGDLHQVYETSVFSLNWTYEDFAMEMGWDTQREYDIQIKSLSVKTQDEMSPETIQHFEDTVIPELEEITGENIDDYCVVAFSITMKIKEEGETRNENSSGTMDFVKIGSKWYIVMPPLEGHEATPGMTLGRATVTGGVQVTALSISKANIGWSDVTISLDGPTWSMTWSPDAADLDGGSMITFNYSARTEGNLTVCCHVADIAGNGVVDGGDFIMLITYEGSPTFSTQDAYTVIFVYEPTGGSMGDISFTG